MLKQLKGKIMILRTMKYNFSINNCYLSINSNYKLNANRCIQFSLLLARFFIK